MNIQWTAVILATLSITTVYADTQNAQTVNAATIGFPLGCVATQTKTADNELILAPESTQKSRVYLLFNQSKKKYLINHVGDPGTASAGWGSVIEPGHWSAILLNQNNFSVNCTEYDGSFTQVLNCNNVMKVCQLSPKENSGFVGQGSFWIAENKTLENLYPTIHARGFKTSE
ncbi:MAG: hypothetical protein A3F17_02680 [Gammaproteobacteria bacterium RIFCSPHIGHO2_12_FULL_41_15]|nr:MAG: hypothetical protein A3F17_02680 [Gammaproteobacteria bacterium RIFCSPHIGHO2_12_FULL_41_15]